ncbi:MAG: hypothetical protein AABZ60_21405, partial [Planctomycetota bacterium]
MFIESYFPVRSDVALAIEYSFCAFLLYFFGRKFIQQVEIAEDLYRKFNTWFGLALLAFLCTVPELCSSVIAITTLPIEHSVDLVAGTLLGANAFSFLLIFLLSFFQKEQPFLFHLRRSLTMAVAYSVLLTSLLGIPILTYSMPSKISTLQNVDFFVLWIPLLVLFFWGFGMKTIFTTAIQEQKFPKFPSTRPPSSLGNFLGLLCTGGILVGTSIWVTQLGQLLSTYPIPYEVHSFRLGPLFVG